MPAPAKPRSTKKVTRWIVRQRVLLSLHMHTPRHEFVACAAYRTLMAEAGIKIDRLKTALRELESGGLIMLCGYSMGNTGNEYLLFGHPDAPSYREWIDNFKPGREWTRDWKERNAGWEEWARSIRRCHKADDRRAIEADDD